MSKAPDLREIFDPPEEIVEAGLNGELVLFIGAGASMLLDLPSWSGLAQCVWSWRLFRSGRFVRFKLVSPARPSKGANS